MAYSRLLMTLKHPCYIYGIIPVIQTFSTSSRLPINTHWNTEFSTKAAGVSSALGFLKIQILGRYRLLYRGIEYWKWHHPRLTNNFSIFEISHGHIFSIITAKLFSPISCPMNNMTNVSGHMLVKTASYRSPNPFSTSSTLPILTFLTPYSLLRCETFDHLWNIKFWLPITHTCVKFWLKVYTQLVTMT